MEGTRDHMKVSTFITSLEGKMSKTPIRNKTFLSSKDIYSAAPYRPMSNQEVNSSYHYSNFFFSSISTAYI